MLKMYGLKNCDTCRKAMRWLESEGIAFDFVDVRKDGIAESDVSRWAKSAGVDQLARRGAASPTPINPRARARAPWP